MTDEERTNRNPKPEILTLKLEDCPELFIKDLVVPRVYILQGQRNISTWNYVGTIEAGGFVGYRFYAPRIDLHCVLGERPDKSGTLEDGRGVKVTIRKYTGPDA